MVQSIDQLPLAQRIPVLADSVRAARARKEQDEQEEARWMDLLAKAEAEVTGKAPGSEGVPLSGLIAEGENPYNPDAAPAGDAPAQGDQVDPLTGESSGGARRPGNG